MKSMGSKEEEILSDLKELPPEDWSKVRDFISYLKNKRSSKPDRGSAEAVWRHFGSWKMTPEEYERIQREIYELRHLEEGDEQ